MPRLTVLLGDLMKNVAYLVTPLSYGWPKDIPNNTEFTFPSGECFDGGKMSCDPQYPTIFQITAMDIDSLVLHI
jgi:hypothetical protein